MFQTNSEQQTAILGNYVKREVHGVRFIKSQNEKISFGTTKSVHNSVIVGVISSQTSIESVIVGVISSQTSIESVIVGVISSQTSIESVIVGVISSQTSIESVIVGVISSQTSIGGFHCHALKNKIETIQRQKL